MRTFFVPTHLSLRILFPAVFLTLVINTPLFADVYKHVDKSGNISFSDVPQKKGDKPISVPEPMTYKSLPAPNSNNLDEGETEKTKPKTISYESVTIATPGDDEAIRSNNGNITVQVSSNPSLQGNNIYVLLLDGNKIQESSGTSFTLTNVDRGTHTISVQIQDDQAQILASSTPVSVHLFRNSVIHHKNAP